MKFITCLTGKITGNLQEVIDSYYIENNYIILSTWGKKEDFSHLKNVHKVIINNPPVKNRSIDYQLCTINSCLEGEVSEETIIIRSRADIKAINYKIFLNEIIKKKLIHGKLMSMAKFKCPIAVNTFYPVDYIIVGYLNDMKKFYSISRIENMTNDKCPELSLFNGYTFDDFIFFCEDCSTLKIEFIWLSKNNKEIIKDMK